jgi:hypothetical protein
MSQDLIHEAKNDIPANTAWRPDIRGWSYDILPWYEKRAEELRDGSDIVEVGVYHGRSLLFLAEKLWEQGALHKNPPSHEGFWDGLLSHGGVLGQLWRSLPSHPS